VSTPTRDPEESARPRRIVGVCRGEAAGPLLLVIASLHGNEPAGTNAVRRVLARLARGRIPLRGDLIGISGNLAALGRGRRFVDEDMNRIWQPDRVASILESIHSGTADQLPARMVGSVELAEQRELLVALRAELATARGPVHVIDLHTTSSESAPFTTLGDTLQNRELALELPLPAVLGLEEQLDGAMLQYLDVLGWRSIGIEGGAHGNPASVVAHEDALWLLLTALDMVSPQGVPDLGERRERLAEAARGLPRVADVRYRHQIAETDGFVMEPGFRNFDPVKKGQALATDRNGVVVAPESGLLFLPLYQKQGDDGFFVVRSVHPAWLGVSRWLRRSGIDRFATWLPGVIELPDRDDTVLLASWAANRVTIGILHLLGYNVQREGGRVFMVRRAETAIEGSALNLGR